MYVLLFQGELLYVISTQLGSMYVDWRADYITNDPKDVEEWGVYDGGLVPQPGISATCAAICAAIVFGGDVHDGYSLLYFGRYELQPETDANANPYYMREVPELGAGGSRYYLYLVDEDAGSKWGFSDALGGSAVDWYGYSTSDRPLDVAIWMVGDEDAEAGGWLDQPGVSATCATTSLTTTDDSSPHHHHPTSTSSLAPTIVPIVVESPMALHQAMNTNAVANDQTIRAVCTANGGTFQFTEYDLQQAREGMAPPDGCTCVEALRSDGYTMPNECSSVSSGGSMICYVLPEATCTDAKVSSYSEYNYVTCVGGNSNAMLEIAPLRTGVALVADGQRCTIAGDGTFRLLYLHRASELALENLVFTRGYTSGVRA